MNAGMSDVDRENTGTSPNNSRTSSDGRVVKMLWPSMHIPAGDLPFNLSRAFLTPSASRPMDDEN